VPPRTGGADDLAQRTSALQPQSKLAARRAKRRTPSPSATVEARAVEPRATPRRPAEPAADGELEGLFREPREVARQAARNSPERNSPERNNAERSDAEGEILGGRSAARGANDSPIPE
jgi:hypothetical protein